MGSKTNMIVWSWLSVSICLEASIQMGVRNI